MRRRILKISFYSVFMVLFGGLAIVAAFYLRLSQGPVALNFMTGTIKEQINRNLSGMHVDIDGVLIERTKDSGVPSFRLSNITLRDTKGNLIARAPRAAIAIEEQALFQGRLVPTSLELIGPRIFIKRNVAGGIELGFGSPATAADESVNIEQDATAGKTDQPGADGGANQELVAGGSLLALLSGDASAANSTISSIADIRVSQASIRLLDEANGAVWDIPRAELAFRRMAYGFAVVTNASVSNGREAGEWHAEISASYRRESHNFAISSRISDLVPANLSDEIFALSQLARVKVPLSGQAEMEISDTGVITKASAEFAAGAGEVGLPDYLAEPIIVDEGSLRADYDPPSGGIIITDSTLLVGGNRAELSGGVRPLRDAEGRLTALKINISARNVAIDAQGKITSAVAIDRIDFSGTAGIHDARLDIDDFVIMSGNSGIRMRGAITGGGESAGILVSGRMRDLSADLLKKIWPPILAPKTRRWVNQNIQAGRISDGEFVVRLPVDAMVRAQRERHLPDNSIDFRFRLADVTTSYFKGLPPIQKGAGVAQLRDNDFAVSLDSATVALPSGKLVTLNLGRMETNDILAVEVPAVFQFDATAAADTLLEYLDLPDLALIRKAGVEPGRFSGKAQLSVTIKMPLVKDVPKERVQVTAEARIVNAAISGALPKFDISAGDFSIKVAKGAIDATGPAKINGVDATISWHRDAGPDAKQSAVIETVLDEDARKKIGVDLNAYLGGTVAVSVTIADLAGESGSFAIAANLSKAAMKIDAINWSRPATPGTTARFTYHGKGDKARLVEGIEISGPGLLIKGDVTMKPEGGMKVARLATVQLSDENRFKLNVDDSGDTTVLDISGESFDARPLIQSMLSTKGADDGAQKRSDTNRPMAITASLGRVYAHRGEVLTGVTAHIQARAGKVEAAEISGAFVSGQPIILKITPVKTGREMRINGRDGGAAMRAANLYSKIAGGQIEFYALMANDARSTVKNGTLVLRNFDVRDEAALAQLDMKGRPVKSGQKRDGISFSRLTLPFTTDDRFVHIGESLIKGGELGASAEGLIRKSDGAIDITGTIIPAYALNSALSGIPLVGDILTGGRGQGIIGLTFALGGSIEKPKFQVNPVSAIAPGILRKFFEFNAADAPPVVPERNKDGKN